MQMRPSRRRSSRWSALTRATTRPTVSQPTRSSPVIGVLAICCASQATTSSKSRVCAAPGRGLRDGLQPHAAAAAPEPAQLTLDPAATGAEIEVAPALDAVVVDLQVPAGLAALGAHPPAAP